MEYPWATVLYDRNGDIIEILCSDIRTCWWKLYRSLRNEPDANWAMIVPVIGTYDNGSEKLDIEHAILDINVGNYRLNPNAFAFGKVA